MSASSTVHFFLKLDQVVGESRSAEHPKEIELRRWSWGETQTAPFTSDAKKATANVAMRDFSFSAFFSSASPNLILYCAAAKLLKTAELSCEKILEGSSARHKYLTILMSNVMIASYEVDGDNELEIPMDKVGLRFEKIEVTYASLKADGTPGPKFESSWDLAINRS